jgi:hypothetical protein
MLAVCALAQDFLQEQDFLGSNLIAADHVGKNSAGGASAKKALWR